MENKPETIPQEVLNREPYIWMNPGLDSSYVVIPSLDINITDIRAAQARWIRFQPLIARLFPQTVATNGRIDSDLIEISDIPSLFPNAAVESRIFVKTDHDLPITGTIKARGGIYEVLTIAEKLALSTGLISSPEDTLALDSPKAAEKFSRFKIIVGSTGNLGFSVGAIARSLGFKAEVHMSKDAKSWKKDRLRRIGVSIVEHPGSYTSAVAAARASAELDQSSFFIDDENSRALFLGYSTAAFDLVRQLKSADVAINADTPANVYLPCGVGGAPGGITFGLKALLGDAVRCYFIEPVNAPCMLVQLASGSDIAIALEDLGLNGETIADGLAVTSASMLVARLMDRLVDGCLTCTDADMVAWVQRLWEQEGLRLEPSAAAPFCGLSQLLAAGSGSNAVHVLWTTGGSHLPDEEFLPLINREPRSVTGDEAVLATT
ncbi:D-serine ammonia-lyase [Aminobacter sp. P9b]|uniref:D-serine ammonia-lyase n=1 Tax=Aminobacter sp. P9b TaxID=3133697 RepID=UPI003250CBD1